MRQLLTFFGLAYLSSWIIWLPLYGHTFGVTNLPILPYQHGFGGVGPLLASFLTTWLYSGKKGFKLLLKNCYKVTPFLYLAIALFSPFLIFFIALVFNYFITKSPVNLVGIFSSDEFPHFNLVTLFAYNLVFFGFGEEVGWRGFALPRLQEKFSALTSSIILTFFWSVWHWPLFLYRPGYNSMDIVGIWGWAFSLLTGSILLTWLFNASRASILICAVFHATIDIVFTTNHATTNINNYIGFLITVWGVLIIVIYKPLNLAPGERVKKTIA